MAVKTGTKQRLDNGVVLYTWSDLDADNSDTGSPMLVIDQGPLDVQVVGTLSGTTVALQGSMDGTNWATITLSPTPLVAATISRAAQSALYIRPALSGGTAANLVVKAVITPIK